MNAVYARNPLHQLHPMATNRPTTRRKSTKHTYEDEDAPPAKRPRTEVNGTGRKTNGTTKKAPKTGAFAQSHATMRRDTKANNATAYDEDDDGFQFTRRTSRRTAAKTQPVSEPMPEPPLKPVPTRRRKEPTAAPEPAQPETQKIRRSTRLSIDKQQLEAHAEAAQPPKRTKKGVPVDKKRQVTPAPEAEPVKKIAITGGIGVQTPKRNEIHVDKRRDGGATKIMLPFADTPVITRNKEMRKGSKDGHRRSSTGMRGRRASSLIDSGLSNGKLITNCLISRSSGLLAVDSADRNSEANDLPALPHSEVEVRDFYKYIEQSQPEPRRMKQLLTWCGSRALPEKPSGNVKDSNAIMSGK
jgi:kinetochore protein Mis13/DSN1